MTKPTSENVRFRRRSFLVSLGIGITLSGVLLFMLGMGGLFTDRGDEALLTQLVVYAIWTISFGGLFSIVFGRVGWHQTRWIDVLLNQLSVLLAVGGILLALLGDLYFGRDFIHWGMGLCLLGFLLSGLGQRWQSDNSGSNN